MYDERKTQNANFSYRFIGQKSGFKSAGFFSLILQGKSNISTSMALRLTATFKLKKHESEYFELLVMFNQAKTQSEKKHYFDKILLIRKSKVKTIEVAQYQLFEEWYYPVFHALLDYRPFNFNLNLIQRKFCSN